MSSAQERAFARLASRRGLLETAVAEAAISDGDSSGPALPQALVGEGLLSPRAASELLRELAGTGWACGRCARVLTWGQLASLPSLDCPEPNCAGEIVPVGGGREGMETVRDQVRPDSTQVERGDRTEFVKLHRPSGTHPGVTNPQPPQRRMGAYTLLSELGRGSNGVVYLAERPGHEGRFAVKVLKDSDLADEETVARFQLEAAVANKIDHPGVIRVHEVGRDGERFFFAMEFCPGKTLKDEIKSRRALEPRAAAELLRDLALTLEATHKAGVIHRDIKPSNIILEERSGRPRLTDFGLARDHSLLRSMTQTGDLLGTPYYMAPEQFRGERELDHRIDLYALGVILYEALTGQRPHDAATPMLLAERVINTDPVSPCTIDERISTDLGAICACAMARDPAERYPTAAALAYDLERFLAGERPRARSGGLPLVPVLALVIVLLLSALGGVVAWRGLGAEDPEQATRLAQARTELTELTALIDGQTLLDAPGQRSELVERLRSLERRSHGDDDLVRAVVSHRKRVEAREIMARAIALARERKPFSALRPLFARARAACLEHPRDLDWIEGVLAGTLLRRGRSAEALEVLSRLLDRGKTPQIQLLRARGLEGQRRRSDALAQYQAVSEGDGAVALHAKAAWHRLRGEHAQAEALARQAVEAGARVALVEQGLAALETEPARAELVLTHAKDVAADDPRVAFGLGVMRLHERKHEVALLLFEQAEGLYEEDISPETTTLRGLCLLRMKRLNSAQRAFDRVLRTYPESVAALVHRGALALMRGKSTDAANDWKRAAGLDRATSLAVFERWYKLEMRRNFQRAVGLEIDPDKTTPSPVDPPAQPSVRDLQTFLLRAFGGRRDSQRRLFPPLTQPPSTVQDRIDGRIDGLPAAQATDLRSALEEAARGGAWSRVAPLLERAYGRDPAQPLVAKERLRLLIAADDIEGASKALAAARRSNLLSPGQAAWCAGEIAWRAGDEAAAIASYEDCARQSLKTALGRVARSRLAFLAGDYAAAGRFAAAATAKAEDSIAAWLAFALAAQAEGDINGAWRGLNKAFGIGGARESLLFAGRAALVASVRASNPTWKGERTSDQLRLAQGPFARLVAARLALVGSQPEVRAWGRKLLAQVQASCTRRPDWFLLWGFSELSQAGEKAKVLGAWETARRLKPGFPIPRSYLDAYRRRFGTSGLERLGR